MTICHPELFLTLHSFRHAYCYPFYCDYTAAVLCIEKATAACPSVQMKVRLLTVLLVSKDARMRITVLDPCRTLEVGCRGHVIISYLEHPSSKQLSHLS